MKNKKHPNDKLLMKWGTVFLFLGVMPIFIIFYLGRIESDILYSMYEKIQNAPSIYTSTYPVISKLSFFYCKLSPPISVFYFIFCYKKLALVNPVLSH